MNNILSELNFGKVADLSSIKSRALKLPVGANYLRCKTFNPKDVNTTIINYYQIGSKSCRMRVLMGLLKVVAHAPMFDQLRTKEQLAYGVSFDWYYRDGMLGYSITVNSQESKFTVDYIDDRIENFRRKLVTIIENMADDDFENIKVSMAKFKLNQNDELIKEVDHNWSEIIYRSDGYEFDRVQKEVECLSTITKPQLLEFYRANLGEAERKLSIQVIGNAQEKDIDTPNDVETELKMNEDLETCRRRFDTLTYVGFNGEPKGNLIHDLMEFKKTLEICSVSKVK